MGCRKLTRGGPCHKHAVERQRERDEAKDQASVALYHTRLWSRLRLAVLGDEPLCRFCKAEGTVEAATVVDHVQPHRGDPVMFFRRSNLQALCKPHHDAKTGREVHLRRAAHAAAASPAPLGVSEKATGGRSDPTPPLPGDRRAGDSRARPGFRSEESSPVALRGPDGA